MRVLVDFHHSSLLRSLVMLFEDRLGAEVYRPIGMDWFHEGYWAINDQEDTARQFLSTDGLYVPKDGTPLLNKIQDKFPRMRAGHYRIDDSGGETSHWAITLEAFAEEHFDFVIASIPAHVPIFKKLIEKYQPNAKLIIQMGNNWAIDNYPGENVLASIAPQLTAANAMFYHQEFDLEIFKPAPVEPSRKIYSFLNIIQNSGIGWTDYQELKKMLERQGFEFRAYGGQCPDGNMTGARELADKMRESMMIFHVKPGGDGFGHIIHNAYAVGRPVITRSSHYKGQLADLLLVPGTFIDLDKYGRAEVKNMLTRLAHDPDGLRAMGERAHAQFMNVVDYNRESEEISKWLKSL